MATYKKSNYSSSISKSVPLKMHSEDNQVNQNALSLVHLGPIYSLGHNSTKTRLINNRYYGTNLQCRWQIK